MRLSRPSGEERGQCSQKSKQGSVISTGETESLILYQ